MTDHGLVSRGPRWHKEAPGCILKESTVKQEEYVKKETNINYDRKSF
jgi:hypothetical protein